ncbi:MAG TPA: 23S rRNA (pseudouridine(1915)-N(3))-methyltransferase RlmH, partial [bacterium]|nr:23S rRNA (pseudouridine(1915)-N(3))-methyltransferase RlmH [bacterium]
MARLRVLCVGKTQPGFMQQGVEHYLGRVHTLHALDWEELRTAGHSGRSPAQALEREGDDLLRRLPAGERMVLLDEAGQRVTSPELAGWLRRYEEEGQPVTFVVGGAYGVSSEVR